MSEIIKNFAEQIEYAFKSLMQSGRPDILDENENNITSDIYIDLFENNYMLRQVLDNNHTLLKGRRGTGKSTIFVKAEEFIRNKMPNAISIYINLQTCYEEVKVSNVQQQTDFLTKLRTYKIF
jgi:predicted AAA+ superfamily ATPase